MKERRRVQRTLSEKYLSVFARMRGGDGRRVFSTLGEKRYCGDKDAVSCKDRRGVGGSGTEYESWGLYVLVGGDGTRYCGEKAGATVKFFGLGEEGAGNLV